MIDSPAYQRRRDFPSRNPRSDHRWLTERDIELTAADPFRPGSA
jgi:hypothetical protein